MRDYIINVIKNTSVIERETFNSDGECCSLPDDDPAYILDKDDIFLIAEIIELKYNQNQNVNKVVNMVTHSDKNIVCNECNGLGYTPQRSTANPSKTESSDLG